MQQQAQQLPLVVPPQLADTELPDAPDDVVNFSAVPPSATTTELFSDIDVSEMTVTLSMDEVLGAPCYQISSSSSSGSVRSAPSPAASEGLAPYHQRQQTLTPAQEEAAINFILS
jgi:hypothetical protein